MDSKHNNTMDARLRDRDPAEPESREPLRRLICPTCKRSLNLPADHSPGLPRFFPFCSERCKLIDLGAWLDADYRIPAQPDDESEESLGTGPQTPPDALQK